MYLATSQSANTVAKAAGIATAHTGPTLGTQQSDWLSVQQYVWLVLPYSHA